MFSPYGLLATAVIASGANAIMIPPDVTMAATGFGVDPFAQIVRIPCPGCPLAQFGKDGLSWTQNENYLVANISVGSNSQTLELNGIPFYPPVMNLVHPEVLQVPADMSMEQLRSPARLATPAHSVRLTAWSFESKGIRTSKNNLERVLNLSLRIHAIEQKAVRVPELLITAVETTRGDLLIVKAEASDKPASPKASQKECRNWPLLCKWRAIVADRLETMRTKMHGHGCGKKGQPGMQMHHGKRPHRPHHKKPHHGHDNATHTRPHHRPHHHHAKPHGHRHHKMHRFMHNVARVLLVVVIPVLIGILAGMITYLIGMLVGTAIALVWIKLRRRQASYQPIALSEEDAEAHHDSEKGVFTEESYSEAPPLYEEVEEKKPCNE
ncbi:hypothetical protein BT63DRAFT_451885 [Microthyrium microscopicum]|uniref:DUF7728 domain-containing protein n=1 Tax=Microthyrium microscopicum TaxID=703497 RepID=A0A6A6UPX2_9PEZI|nr:hypothetical protein BT63DRAFT_451885 [Microthyrium microscopicum]